jgi:hypothetical protein
MLRRKAVVVTHYGGVVTGEFGEPRDEVVVAVFDDGCDGLSGLEWDERVVGIRIGDAMYFGAGPAELIDHRDDVSRLGEIVPVKVCLVRRDFADLVARARWEIAVRWPWWRK